MNIDSSANVARVRRWISPLLPNQIAHHSCASGTHVDSLQKHRFESDPTRHKHMNSPLFSCLVRLTLSPASNAIQSPRRSLASKRRPASSLSPTENTVKN